MGYRLGVDLGTTFTAAAVRRDGVSHMVTLGVRQPEMPSTVAVSGGEVRVGDGAEHHGRTEPASIARFFKRRFADSTPLVVNGQPWSAEALSARVLRHVLDEVTRAEGSAPDHVVLTHPAGWREFRLDAMHAMAEMAELASYELVPEPVAAARHYAVANRLPNDARLVVFDFGGGTFDTSVVAVVNGEFEVLGTPQGIERLGGIDIDEAVFSHACDEAGIDPYSLADTPQITRDLQRLRLECRDAKEILSTAQAARIAVRVGDVDTDIELTRGVFESMLTPMLADAGAAVDRAIRSVDLGHAEIDALLLVGGTSRIPAVGEALSQRFGRPILIDTHPKHAVALGAALSGPQETPIVPPHPAGFTTELAPTPPAPPPARPTPPTPPPTLAEAGFAGDGIGHSASTAGDSTVPANDTSGSRTPLILALAALLVLVVGGGAFALIQARGDSDPTAAVSSSTQVEPVENTTSTAVDAPVSTTEVASETTAVPDSSEERDLVVVPQGESIQIRLLGDVSGAFVDVGTLSVALSEQAIEDFGPVMGFDVSFGTVLDTACSETEGVAAANIVADTPGVIGVIGPQCSGSILGASPGTTQSGAVMIAPAGGWPTLTSNLEGVQGSDYHDGFYRLIQNDLAHPVALADYATTELGMSRAAVVHGGVPYELEMNAAFVSRFEANGGQVVLIEDVGTGGIDGLAETLASADVEFVYLSLQQADAGEVLEALDGLGDWTLSGPHWLFDEQFLSAQSTEGLIFTAPLVVNPDAVNQGTNQSSADVLSAYESASGRTVSTDVWARSYDATILLLAAIEASSTVDGDGLVIDRAGVGAFLDGVSNYSGLSGTITCDNFGDCTRSPIVVGRNVDPSNFANIEILDEFDDFG